MWASSLKLANLKTAIIIEDEFPARLRLKKLLEVHSSEIKVIAEADTGTSAITFIEEKKPELIFLDIQLPDMTGFDVLKKLSYQPWIIFTTAYSEYALKAFETLSIDYLVKPIEQERFDLAIKKLTKWESHKSLDLSMMQLLINDLQKPKALLSLSIKKKDKIILVDFDQVSHFKAEDKYVNVHLLNGDKHLMSKTLSQIETTLPENFARVHRSYIVNKNIVVEIEKHFKGKFVLQLNDKSQSKIKTGETYTKVVKEYFNL